MSLKKNFLYSSILTVSTYLFPFLVYPYVSRTLGLSNIGIVNFVDNVINYFVLVSMMGIATVGVREIAASRNERRGLSKTFMSLLSLNAITTLIAVVALVVAMFVVPKLMPYRDLLGVGVVKLVFNLFLLEWFFAGMEDFKYITNRSLIVKCLYVLSVFVFVRDASDYRIYYVISVAMVVVNAVINIVYSRRFIDYDIRLTDFRPYLRAFFIMGVYVLLTNVYTSLNAVWLGFVTDTDEVGFFTTATKLHVIIMSVLASLTSILFPRVSSLLAENKRDEYWDKISTSLDAIYLFAFPTIAFVCVAGPALLHIIVGDGFEGSYLPLRIITPLVLVIGIEQILVIQILMAMHKDGIVLRNSFVGAAVSVLFNMLLTARLGAVGSAIVWVVAECAIMLVSMVDIYRSEKFVFPFARLLAYCLSYAPLIVGAVLTYRAIQSEYIAIIAVAMLTVAYAAVNESFVMKNKVADQFVSVIRRRINGR